MPRQPMHRKRKAPRLPLGPRVVPHAGSTNGVEDRSAARRAPLAPASLPVYPSRLIGREPLVAQLEQMLTTGLVRLVTLTGPGGIGKTRVACEAASRLRDRYARVHFIDLTPERDPAAVLPAVRAAVATGDQGEPSRPRVLVLLDNFEHLLDAASDLGDLLRDDPGIAMIVTSRAVLGLRWEHAVAVPPLALDDPAGHHEDAAWRAPAVELFVEAVRRHHPDFALTPDTAPLVGEICAALEGVPLALELAAARTKLLSLNELRQRLREPLDLLRAGHRDLPRRQQALRHSAEWSSQLLTPVELATARQLAVIAGGGTLEIADAVVRLADDQDGEWLLDALVGLVDKSIISIDVRDDPAPRFRMLASVRAWFREQLAEEGQLVVTERRFLDWVLAHAAQQAERAATSPGDAFDALDQEWDNLAAAFERLLELGETDPAERLALALGPFWQAGWRAVEGRDWLDRLQALDTPREPARVGELLLAGARLALRAADLDRAGGALDALAELSGDALAEGRDAQLALLRATIAQRAGDEAALARALREARARIDAAGDPAAACQLLLLESAAAIDRHDLTDATRAAHAAATLAREQRLLEQQALAAIQLAGIEILLGHVDSADAALPQAHALAHQARSRTAVILARVGQGAVAAERGDVALAMRHYREALDGYRPGDAADALLAALDAVRTLAIQPDATGEVRAVADLSELRALRRHRWRSPLPWLAHLSAGEEPERDVVLLDEPAGLPAELERAMRAVRTAGGTPVPEALSSVAFAVPEEAEDLSLRERQVVRCVAQGMTNRQIADELGIAERTVDSHVGNVLRKLKLRSRAAIAAWAVQFGLHAVDLESGGVRTGTSTDGSLRKG